MKWTKFLFLCLMSVMASFAVSCGSENDEPVGPTQPDSKSDAKVEIEDLILTSNHGGSLKFHTTGSVAYYTLLYVSKQQAETMSQETLANCLSDKDASKRLIPTDEVRSISYSSYETEYIIYTKAYEKEGVSGPITKYEFRSPKQNNPGVTVYYSGNLNDDGTSYSYVMEVVPDDKTMCWYLVYVYSDKYEINPTKAIWESYHKIKEAPGKYRNFGNQTMELTKDFLNSNDMFVIWSQDAEGNLSPGIIFESALLFHEAWRND